MKPSTVLVLFVVASIAAIPNLRAEESSPEAKYESPGGSFRIVGDDTPELIFKSNPKKRVRLPDGAQGSRKGNDFYNPDEEFHASPDDRWLFTLHHVGSGLRDGNLYRVGAAGEVALEKKASPFSPLAWRNGLKLGALHQDFSADGLYAMTRFVGWSADSVRLLIRLGGGEKKGSFTERFLYFNTRTQSFEVTDYLRRLNKLSTTPLACAEPLTPLPDEAALKTRYAEADATLNKVYAARLVRLEKDTAANLRDEQRDWIKRRDAGIAPYVNSFPAAEKERRRLQYLAAVTIARQDEVPWFPQ